MLFDIYLLIDPADLEILDPAKSTSSSDQSIQIDFNNTFERVYIYYLKGFDERIFPKHQVL